MLFRIFPFWIIAAALALATGTAVENRYCNDANAQVPTNERLCLWVEKDRLQWRRQ